MVVIHWIVEGVACKQPRTGFEQTHDFAVAAQKYEAACIPTWMWGNRAMHGAIAEAIQ